MDRISSLFYASRGVFSTTALSVPLNSNTGSSASGVSPWPVRRYNCLAVHNDVAAAVEDIVVDGRFSRKRCEHDSLFPLPSPSVLARRGPKLCPSLFHPEALDAAAQDARRAIAPAL